MDDRRNILGVVFMVCVVLPITFFISILESVEQRKMARCYRKKGTDFISVCEKRKCFLACCALQEEMWLEGIRKKAAKGDKEAQATLDFYYYCEY